LYPNNALKLIIRMYRRLLTILLASLSGLVFAQQDPQFSHYYFNHLFLNPGAAGSENVTRFQGIYRTQYTGYTGTFDDGGGPTTQVFSANVPLKQYKSGVGVYFMNDRIGFSTAQDIQLSYAYHLPVGGSQLAIGVRGGLYTRGIDYSRLRARDDNDPVLATGDVRQSQFDLGAGLYLYNPSYTIGLSMNHINEPKFGLKSESGQNPLKRSAYLTANATLGLSYTLDITPMAVVKYDFATISAEGGAIVTYDGRYYFGASYRLQDAATGLAGINLFNNNLRLGYAFDFIITGANAKAPTSHEIMASYTIQPFRSGKKSIIRTPRYRY
jgi:type IX secretion system PorP/SprF family membrane protein